MFHVGCKLLENIIFFINIKKTKATSLNAANLPKLDLRDRARTF